MDEVKFYNTTFDTAAIFYKTNFGFAANFTRSTFKGRVELSDAVLPDYLFLSHVKTTEEIDLTYMRLDSLKQICVIDLYSTDINKLRFDYSRFQIRRDSSYERKHLSHLYEQILKMQRDKGFIDGYEKADKEYRHFKLTYQRPPAKKFFGSISSAIQRGWWDYGYSKGRILLIILFFVSLFTFTNFFYFRKLNENVYKIEGIYKLWKLHDGQPPTKIAGAKSPVSFNNFTTSFFYTSVIFFGLRLNIDSINFSKPGWVFYLFVQYALGIICLAYLANFILD